MQKAWITPGRRIRIASYQPAPEQDEERMPGPLRVAESPPERSEAEEVVPRPTVGGMRRHFPDEGEELEGGVSDGWEFRTTFRGGKLEATYEMVRTFLREQGYADVPLPADAEELLRFRHPRGGKQLLLFGDNGYVHNPIKILFADNPRNMTQLTLCLFNERAEGHLLRFHRRH
ncbi:MAG: hypothetical protein WBA17_02170 [Saprospiraceae bacterium]